VPIVSNPEILIYWTDIETFS